MPNESARPLEIVMVAYHGCIRVVKQALALHDAGHIVKIVTRGFANREMDGAVPSMAPWQTVEDLKGRLSGSPPDIIHVHNEPSWMVTTARQCQPTATIVFDCHDLDLVRKDEPTAEEALAFLDCDGAVYVSETCRRIAEAGYRHGKPGAVIRSWLTADMLALAEPQTRTGGLVYEGGCAIGERLDYCDYRAVAEQCRTNGIPLFMLSGDPRFGEPYMAAGAFYTPPMNYAELLRQVSRFDYGLCAPGADDSKQWRRTLPNKLWEYVAAGIPVICWSADECAAVIREHGIGEVLENRAELTAQRWAQLLSRREWYAANVRKVRDQFTMERQLPDLMALYTEAALGRERANAEASGPLDGEC